MVHLSHFIGEELDGSWKASPGTEMNPALISYPLYHSQPVMSNGEADIIEIRCPNKHYLCNNPTPAIFKYLTLDNLLKLSKNLSSLICKMELIIVSTS